MPLNTNNIDVTVAANGVYGTTSAILNGLVEPDILDDQEIRVYSLLAFISYRLGRDRRSLLMSRDM